jgi:DNA-directed RNA polymerase specialized sigma24 family protein
MKRKAFNSAVMTRWTLIQRMQSDDSEQARSAFGEFYSLYLTAIVDYFRRAGYKHDADDVAGEFTLWLLEKQKLQKLRRDQRSFRGFLAHALWGFHVDLQRRQHAEYRGGKASHVTMDASAGVQLATAEDCEQAFNVAFFQHTMSMVMEDVVRNTTKKNPDYVRAMVRRLLEDFLPADTAQSILDYDDIAVRFGVNPATLRMHKAEYRQALSLRLRIYVDDQLDDPAKTDDEIRQLQRDVRRTRQPRNPETKL